MDFEAFSYRRLAQSAGLHGDAERCIDGGPEALRRIRATFEDAEAADPRDTQYFELWGSRAIYHRGWKAVAIHVPGTPFEDGVWELYHVEEDFSESLNVATEHPERLEALKALWWSEAEKNGAVPLPEAPGGRRNTYRQRF